MTLVEFIRARLDAAEEPARRHVDMMDRVLTPCEEWTHTHQWVCVTEHSGGGSGYTFARGAPSPTEVLAWVAATRTRVDLLATVSDACPPDDWPDSGDMAVAAAADLARHLLLLEALPWRTHPDYDPAWSAP